MLSKLSLLAICAAPLASALTLHPLTEPTSQGTVTITWDTAPGDPEFFSIELNHPSFNDALAIATTVDSALGEHTVTIPVVPAQDGYTLEAVNIGNIDDVYSHIGPFSIGASTQPPPSSMSTRPFSSGTASPSSSATRSGSSGVPSNSASHSGSGSAGSETSSTHSPSPSNLIEDNAASAFKATSLGFVGAMAAGAAILF